MAKVWRTYRIAIVSFMMAVAFTAIWRIYCMPYADDFIYTHVFQVPELRFDTENTVGPPIAGISDWAASVGTHWMAGNGRLASILSFTSALLPRWFNVVLCVLAIACYPFLMLIAAGGRALLRRPIFVAVTLLLSWFAFPWSDHMESEIFLHNYVFSADAFLAVVILARHSGQMKKGWFAVLCILAILASWMHEGFGIPLVVYLAAMAVADKDLRRRYAWLAAAAAVGFLLSLSPGTLGKLLYVKGEALYPFHFAQLLGYRMLWVFPAAIVVAIVLRRRLAPGVLWRLMAIAASFCAALAIVVVITTADRGLWCTIMLASVGTLVVANCLVPAASRGLGNVLSAALLCLYAAFMANLCYWQSREAAECHRVSSQLGQGSNVVFADLQPPQPWTTLDIPITNRYSDWTNLYLENQAACTEGFPAVVPERYRGLPFAEWDCIPGNASFRTGNGLILSDIDLGTIHAELHYGEPTRAMNPLNRALAALLQRRVFDTVLQAEEVGVYGRDTIYIYFHNDPGRLFRGRPIERIDIFER